MRFKPFRPTIMLVILCVTGLAVAMLMFPQNEIADRAVTAAISGLLALAGFLVREEGGGGKPKPPASPRQPPNWQV